MGCAKDCEFYSEQRGSTGAVVLNMVLLYPGSSWQCLVVMTCEGVLLASSW